MFAFPISFAYKSSRREKYPQLYFRNGVLPNLKTRESSWEYLYLFCEFVYIGKGRKLNCLSDIVCSPDEGNMGLLEGLGSLEYVFLWEPNNWNSEKYFRLY